MSYCFKSEIDNGNIALYFKGAVVGSIWWRVSGKQTVEIELLEVEAAHRRKGLGTKLLNLALQKIKLLFPKASYVSGLATSQGIVRLLRHELGRELTYNSLADLPQQAPAKWRATLNRVRVRFKLR